jgi:hypothetical protein
MTLYLFARRSIGMLVVVLLLLPLPGGVGPQGAAAADGLAQLRITTHSPIKTLTIVGANQHGEAMTKEIPYGASSTTTDVVVNDWWWRFKWKATIPHPTRFHLTSGFAIPMGFWNTNAAPHQHPLAHPPI